MIKYKLKSDIFKGFACGEIIYPHNEGCQFGKEFSKVGDPCIDWNFIEKMPELFEEIKDSDYTIVSFRHLNDGKILKINSSGNYGDYSSLQSLLPYIGKSFEILRVMRNSDKEEFEIGDICNLLSFNNSSIERFEIDAYKENKIYAMCGNYGKSITELKKARQIVFTTNDGEHIYLRNRYFSVKKSTFSMSKHKCSEVSGRDTSLVYFSSRSLAVDYIRQYSLMYSLQDIENCFGEAASKMPLYSAFIEKLKKSIIKTK